MVPADSDRPPLGTRCSARFQLLRSLLWLARVPSSALRLSQAVRAERSAGDGESPSAADGLGTALCRHRRSRPGAAPCSCRLKRAFTRTVCSSVDGWDAARLRRDEWRDATGCRHDGRRYATRHGHGRLARDLPEEGQGGALHVAPYCQSCTSHSGSPAG
eukprot:SAG31_NODE_4159_length_3524_cov_2.556788_6_plen_160_part_00